MGFRVMLGKDEIQQAEAIARHYVAHAQIALQALRLIELRQQYEQHLGRNPLNSTISRLIETIKSNHARDLGIELEWPREPKEISQQ